MFYWASGTPGYGNDVLVEIPGSGGNWASSNPWVGNVNLTPGTWNMLSVTVGASGWDLYVNGALDYAGSYNAGVFPIAFTSSGQSLTIGASTFYNAFNGSINDFYYFNTALSAAQIQQLYQAPDAFGTLAAASPVTVASGAIST